MGEAISRYEQAIALKPKYAEALCNLGVAFTEQANLYKALDCFDQAIAIKPDYADAHSNRAFCLNYLDKVTPHELFSAHIDWHKQIRRVVSIPSAYPNTRETYRRLKVGYVSPDLCQHSVAYFVEPLLKAHNRQAVEVYCYADVARSDSVTARLRGYSDHWLTTIGQLDEELAARIRIDGIDILVDLAGYTSGNRLGVFAQKPSPIQVSWLRYPNTTGLDTIDYRIVDAVTDPIGEADAWASETLLRLEDGFLCYSPIEDGPPPTLPPCLADDRVTFGSFNNPAKLSDSTLDIWAKLLNQLPRAGLLLKGKPFGEETTRALFLSRLAARGVDPARVELAPWRLSEVMHLEIYGRVDIALNSFPYNGANNV